MKMIASSKPQMVLPPQTGNTQKKKKNFMDNLSEFITLELMDNIKSFSRGSLLSEFLIVVSVL
jgi:hypothetical protein